MIWNKNYAIEEINQFCANTLLSTLDIKIQEIGSDYLMATMPVTHKHVQPQRILHGGASVALAESLGSIASHLIIQQDKYYAVGLEINANHIRPVAENSSIVTGIAKPIHLGSKTHVWEIKITDSNQKLVCISRLTVAILNKK